MCPSRNKQQSKQSLQKPALVFPQNLEGLEGQVLKRVCMLCTGFTGVLTSHLNPRGKKCYERSFASLGV